MVREGSSHLWAVKGTEVSMVRVVESSAAAEEEIGRRRGWEAQDKAAVRGRRRLERDDDVAMCERAISIVGLFSGRERFFYEAFFVRGLVATGRW